ncbi:MAG: type II secretion system GspH family protein, partial [Alphaproteobacteria bacterium]|nr:type II secretion system GspH family protein [Alphaproteobacteria bacterium]
MHILTRNHRSRGFTLIEMSMVIVILGMAAAGVSQLAGLYFKNQDFKRTETNIHVISSAIGNFRSLHGRYPCPASITEERSDIEYGRENCGDLSSTAPGSCIDGICVEESLRTMTYLNQFTREFVTGKPRVRVGFIPFRQLNLDEEEVYDAYGN